jgi:predicted glycoside hydrolase/deacetylase ChbG (UPF0249 family)
MNYLIVNADDFGYSFGINKGIIEAHKNGIVTSTTVMVDGIAANEASALIKYPDLSVGLHFYPKSLDDIAGEFKRQLDIFISIIGKKPDHIDTHKRNPADEPEIEKVIRDYSIKNNIPVRGFEYVKLIESFFAENRTVEEVSIEKLKMAVDEATEQFNEIMCHAGYSDDYLRQASSYNDIRDQELKTLTSPTIKEYIASKPNIQLSNWSVVKIL